MEKKLIISKDNIEMLKEIISKYKPYCSGDPEYNQFDGEYDLNRAKATTAKRILDDIEAYPEKYVIQ